MLCSFETSYFPSTLKLWNDLNNETRNISTLLHFKSSIRHQPARVGEHLSVGERKYNIILTRIRHRCSSLNADLFHVNIVPYSNCSCGVLVENAEDYLFECTLYNTQRQRLLQTIRQIQTIPTVNFDLLTNGSTLHDGETNKQIILAVLKFIKTLKDLTNYPTVITRFPYSLKLISAYRKDCTVKDHKLFTKYVPFLTCYLKCLFCTIVPLNECISCCRERTIYCCYNLCPIPLFKNAIKYD